MASKQLLNSISKYKAIRIIHKIGKNPYLFNHKKNLKILSSIDDKELMSLMINTRSDDEN